MDSQTSRCSAYYYVIEGCRPWGGGTPIHEGVSAAAIAQAWRASTAGPWMNAPTELVRYDAMCRAIDEAYQVDEVKDIRDKAQAIEHYSRQAKNTEAERQACEIRLRAERKVGQLLAGMEKNKGAAQPTRSSDTTTLVDLGISKDQSSKWQQLAAVPDNQFESALAAPDKPTTSGIIREAREPE